VHVFGFPPAQVPDWQVSVCVQKLLSLQLVPLDFATGAGQPLAGTHAPTVWHWSAVQVTGLPPEQAPDWQVSPIVQALLSVQVVPFATVGFEQSPVAGAQVPATWH
jgi:hypothetical protein